MARSNEHYRKLAAGYLFPEIGRRVAAFATAHPQAPIIRLGIGDVTLPLVPAVVDAMRRAVDELGTAKGFRGYAPDQGYEFLLEAIREEDYASRGVTLDRDAIFVSDGSKQDSGNIQEIFGADVRIAVTDPVYPVYVDTNVMAGRAGNPTQTRQFDRIVYMPCTAENNFVPALPASKVDLIYLCYPNNPTGAVATKEQLKKWVDYARQNRAIIFFDAAYEAFITDPEIPHSIYEIEGAKEVAIEFRSFSKTAGFTGIRCAFTVVPKQLNAYTKAGQAVDVNPIWNRRHATKFNGACYIAQAGAAAVYTPEGQKQCRRIVSLYMKNAAVIRKSLTKLGYQVYGGINAPYIWLKTPNSLSSWDFFDLLLNNAHLVGTPGSGFGPAGERYFRLTAFGNPDDVKDAMQRFACFKL